VVVISPTTSQIIKSIPVPAPVGLSLTADNTRVLVGSFSQQVTWIDTTSLQVVERDTIPQLSQATQLPGCGYFPIFSVDLLRVVARTVGMGEQGLLPPSCRAASLLSCFPKLLFFLSATGTDGLCAIHIV
jgi:hypothetical protein